MALALPEYYADLAQTTVGSGGYTAGSGSLTVVSAAALSTTRQFHFMITDQTTDAVKCVGKATAVSSNTFTVTMTTDANANAGDYVTITLCTGAIDQIISDCDQMGTYASLPATVPPAGRRYKTTDAPYDFISNGSNWKAFYRGMPCTVPPASGSWTTANLGAHGSLTSTNGPDYLIGSSSSNSDFLSAAYMAAPGSTPYSFTARCAADYSGIIEGIARGSITSGNNIGFSIGWTDGTKYLMLTLEAYGSSPYWDLVVIAWTNDTSVSTTHNGQAFNGIGPMTDFWFKIQNDGTNLNFFISVDGINFYQFYTETITHFLSAATDVAWGTYGHNESAAIVLYDWTQGT